MDLFSYFESFEDIAHINALRLQMNFQFEVLAAKLGGIDGFVGFLKVPFKIVKVLSRENVLDLFPYFESFEDIAHIKALRLHMNFQFEVLAAKLGGIDGFVGCLKVPFRKISQERMFWTFFWTFFGPFLDLFPYFQSFRDIDPIDALKFSKQTRRKVIAL